MDGIETKFGIEWVSVIDDLPSQDEGVMIATFNRFLPSAAWIEDWDTGEPMWYNEQTETELDWTPLFWARYPSLPYRPTSELSEIREYIVTEGEDDDGYDSFVQKGEKGEFAWSQVFGVWGAFVYSDSEEPFFYATSITQSVADAAWREYLRIVSEGKAVGDE